VYTYIIIACHITHYYFNFNTSLVTYACLSLTGNFYMTITLRQMNSFRELTTASIRVIPVGRSSKRLQTCGHRVGQQRRRVQPEPPARGMKPCEYRSVYVCTRDPTSDCPETLLLFFVYFRRGILDVRYRHRIETSRVLKRNNKETADRVAEHRRYPKSSMVTAT